MKAEYIDHMGSDLTVVNSARVSFNKESHLDTDGLLLNTDMKLIVYLAKHAHTTPFTHPQITIRETVPIFVARQRFKHVVGFTYNEVSRRYVDTPPEFFIPDVWRSRPEGSVKQGSGKNTVDLVTVDGIQSTPSSHYHFVLEQALDLYNSMIKDGVAPEQARMVLPQSMYTSYYVTGSLAAWARAYKQRIDAHAQVEIQELAKQWDAILAPLFPISWATLTENA
jgi:thymidylate synthase (FAD)